MLRKLVQKTADTFGIHYLVLAASLVSTYAVAATMTPGLHNEEIPHPTVNPLIKPRLLASFTLPTSFEEIELRYRAQLPRSTEESVLYQNVDERRLLLRALHREIDLRTKTGKLDAKDLKSIHAVLEMVRGDILSGMESAWATRQGFGLTSKRIPSELLPYMDVYVNLEKISFFKEPSYLQWVKSRFPETRSLYNSGIKSAGINQSLMLLPSSRVFEDSKQISKALDSSLKGVSSRRKIHGASVQGSNGASSTIRSFDTLPYFAKERLATELLERNAQPLPMQELLGLMDRPVAQPAFPFLAHPDQQTSRFSYKAPEFLPQRRKMFEQVWKNRGLWATLEMIPESINIDWAKIWAALGIDPAQGKAELIQSVKDFVKTPGYADALRAFAEKPPGNNKWNFPAWADSSLYMHLRGDTNPIVKSNAMLRQAAQRVTGYMVVSDTQTHDREFSRRFKAAITREPKIVEGLGHRILEKLHHVAKNIEIDLNVPEKFHHLMTARLVIAIDQSGLSLETRRKILGALISSTSFPLLANVTKTDRAEVLEVMKQYGFSTSEAMKRARTAAPMHSEPEFAVVNDRHSIHLSATSQERPLLLTGPAKPQVLLLSGPTSRGCPNLAAKIAERLDALTQQGSR